MADHLFLLVLVTTWIVQIIAQPAACEEPANSTTLDARLVEAANAIASGDLKNALDAYQQILDRSQDIHVKIQAALGIAHVLEDIAVATGSGSEKCEAAYRFAFGLCSTNPSATAEERLLTGNDLCVFLTNERKYDAAIGTWRGLSYEAFSKPAAQAIYDYNYGRALEGGGDFESAYQKYRSAVEAKPTFNVAAERAFQILREAKLLGSAKTSIGEAVSLANALLFHGNPDLASKEVHQCLLTWSSDPSALDLLSLLVQYFAHRSLGREEFEEKEWPLLEPLGSTSLGTAIREIHDAYWKNLLPSEAQNPYLFPTWWGHRDHRADFSDLLKKTGDLCDQEGDEKGAIARYLAAWAMDDENADACLYAAAALYNNHDNIDPDGYLLERFVGSIYSTKSVAVSAGDWETDLRLHTVLGNIFAKEKKWGKPDDPRDPYSALFQFKAATDDERRLNWVPAVGLHLSLAETYSQIGKPSLALNEYVGLATAFRAADGPVDTTVGEQIARAIAAFANVEFDAGAIAESERVCDEAIKTYLLLRQQSYDYAPELAGVYYYRGNAFADQRQFEKAVSDYTSALRLKPDFLAAAVGRGDAFAELREFNNAISDYTEALRIKPDSPEIYVGRGIANLNLGQYDNAVVDYTEAIKRKPEFAEAYLNRGIAYNDLKQYDKAIADQTEAIRLRPDYVAAYVNRSTAYVNLRQNDKAIADCTEAIRRKADGVEPYVNRGAAYLDEKQDDKAIADFSNAIRIKPDFAEAYFDRGKAEADLGQSDEAMGDYNEALRLKPDYSDAYLKRGIMFSALKQYDKAVLDFSAAIGIDGNFADAYFNRGVAYDGLKRYAKAVADYSDAIRIQTDYVQAYVNRGTDYDRLKECQRSIVYFTEAIRLKPADANAYTGRGQAYYSLEEFGKAVADYTQAIQLQPNSIEIVQLRSQAYQALGGLQRQETLTKTPQKKSIAIKAGKKANPVVAVSPSATPSGSDSLVQRWFVDHLRRQAHADLFPSASPSHSAKPKQANN